MQTFGDSADPNPVAPINGQNQKIKLDLTADRSGGFDENVANALLSKRFIREHLLMRTVTWTGWMLTLGVIVAAATVYFCFPS